MSAHYTCFLLSTLFCIFALATGQSDSNDTATDDSNLRPEWAYCFDFTWFGPDYDNVTRYNGTCGDYLEETRADENVPCAPPIVISYYGTTPDIDYLWEHHRASVLCRQSENQVCISHKYLYNGKVNNATYTCAKVQIAGEGDVTSGCFKDKRGYYDVELCVCQSGNGLYKPCNGALRHSPPALPLLACAAFFYVYRFAKNLL